MQNVHANGSAESSDSRKYETSKLQLVLAEILSVTTSIRKYSRPSSSSSSFTFASSSTSSSYGAQQYSHGIPLGSYSASLSGNAIAQARRKLASVGVEHSQSDGQSGAASGDTLYGSQEGLKSALNARARTLTDGNGNPKAAEMTEATEHLDPNALLSAFTILRAQLREHSDLRTFPLTLLLAPFLQTILSPRVSAPITSAALQSVNRMLVYQVIPLPVSTSSSSWPKQSQPPGLRSAVVDIARAISHCKFEPSDPTVDELVLLRIVAVMKELVCGTKQVNEDGQGLTLADFLPDESICEMMETGLSMCCQTRLTDLLRKTAEQNLLPMVRHLFSRLASIPLHADEAYSAVREAPPEHSSLAADDVEEVVSAKDLEEKKLRRMTMPDPSGLAVTAASAFGLLSSEDPALDSEHSADVTLRMTDARDIPLDRRSQENSQIDLQSSIPESQPESSLADAKPFSLPAIKEVLRVLISLLDAQSRSHTDSMRLLGLNLLTSAFETAGPRLVQFPSLRSLVQDAGCKNLFQLARSESYAISSFAIRGICTLFAGMRTELKMQYEFLLGVFMDRLGPTYPIAQEPWNDQTPPTASAMPSRSISGPADAGRRSMTPEVPAPPPPPPLPKASDRAPAQGDARDLVLEALALLIGTDSHSGLDQVASCGDPLLELFVNYDCDVNCDDMFTKMTHFLCRSVYASGPSFSAHSISQQDAMQVFALDTILCFVERLAARQEFSNLTIPNADDAANWPDGLATAVELEGARSRKSVILDGARRFNAKPREGLMFLEAQGYITPDESGNKDTSIARFIKDCPRLDKKLLGDFISRPANVGILDAFVRLFQFADKPIAEAMRELLESFRLPGESQQIARITETFAKVYFAAAPKQSVKSEDAVYVLAYSVIMLNTDLHNAQNKRKMSIEDYRRNLRGVNDGADFAEDYLGSIYETIRKREIVMPEEHIGQLGFEYTWKELLRRSRTSSRIHYPETSQFDRVMFTSCWKPLVACISHAFSTFRDEQLLERAISGFRQCAMLASKWGMDEVFDYMIESLASSTGLLDSAGALPPSGSPNNAIVDVEGVPITVSPLSIRFGLNFKGQLAAVVLFTIANGNGAAIRAGWTPIFEIMKNLFASALLPDDLSSMWDFTTPSSRESEASESHSRIPIPFKVKRSIGAAGQDTRPQGGGLFSTLSSYLLSPYGTASEPGPPDASHDEVEASLCTADCIASCRVGDLYAQLLNLESAESVRCALKSLRQLADRLTLGQLAAAAATQQQDGVSGRSTPVQAGSASRTYPAHQLAYDPRAVWALEVLTDLACSAAIVADDGIDEALGHISSLLQSPKSFTVALLERATTSLLRLMDIASEQSSKSQQVSAGLELLKALPADSLPSLSPSIIAGLQQILSRPRTRPLMATSSEWHTIVGLISGSFASRSSQNVELLFGLTSTIATLHLSAANFVVVVHLLRDLAQAADPEGLLQEVNKRERQGYRLTLTEKKELTEYVEACRSKAPLAIELLEAIKDRVPEFLAVEPANDWSHYWLTLTSAVSSQCSNAHRVTRQAALTSLPRILFCEALTQGSLSPSGIRQIVLNSLFPMMEHLLSPEIFAREPDPTAPGGLIETRTRACGILCRSLLSFAGALAQLPAAEFQELWLQVLDLMERLYQSSADDQLRDAVPENLRNVLLILHASGLLSPPPALAQSKTDVADSRSPAQGALWAVTEAKLNNFLPELVQFVMVECGREGAAGTATVERTSTLAAAADD